MMLRSMAEPKPSGAGLGAGVAAAGTAMSIELLPAIEHLWQLVK
jgi:hypothetical protein